MYSKDLQVELIHSAKAEELFHACIALNGGIATRDFFVEDGEEIEGNGAFYSIFMQYLIVTNQMQDMNASILPSSSLITYKNDADKIIDQSKAFLQTLYSLEFNEEDFERARLRAKESYARQYAKGAFRARMKSYEFCHYNKAFSLFQYNNDYNGLTFSKFKELYKDLIIPSNMGLVLLGNEEKVAKQAESLDTFHPGGKGQISYKNFLRNPQNKRDGHVINLAKQNHFYTALSFEFLYPMSLTEKYFYLQVFSEQLPYNNIEINIDKNDASLLFENKSLRLAKPLINFSMPEEMYNEAVRRLIIKYKNWENKYHELLTIEIAARLVSGIRVKKLIDDIKELSYEKFLEIQKRTDSIVTEGQVILRKAQRYEKTRN